MEMAELGAAYFNDYRMTGFSGTVNNHGNFASVLEKAAAKTSKEISTEVSAETSVEGASNLAKTKIDKNDKLYNLCLDLETFLVKNLLTSMRNTVQKAGLIDQGFAGKMYEDMLYDEYAKDFTKHANFGLAEQAYLQLKQRADFYS